MRIFHASIPSFLFSLMQRAVVRRSFSTFHADLYLRQLRAIQFFFSSLFKSRDVLCVIMNFFFCIKRQSKQLSGSRKCNTCMILGTILATTTDADVYCCMWFLCWENTRVRESLDCTRLLFQMCRVALCFSRGHVIFSFLARGLQWKFIFALDIVNIRFHWALRIGIYFFFFSKIWYACGGILN